MLMEASIQLIKAENMRKQKNAEKNSAISSGRDWISEEDSKDIQQHLDNAALEIWQKYIRKLLLH